MKNFSTRPKVDAAGTGVQPAKEYPPVKYNDFSGGFYRGAKNTEVPKNAALDTLDTEVTRDNKLRRAPGTTLMEAYPARTPTQLILHPDMDQTAELLAINGAELGVKREGATVWTNVGLPAGPRYHSALYGGDLLFSNSRDTIFVRHPRTAGITRVPNLPMGRTMAVIAGRLFIGGAAITGNFEAMGQFWTGSENFDDTDVENGSGFESLIADTGFGDHIVANRTLGFDMMAVLCRRSVWIGRITGDPNRPLDFSLRFPGKGCVSEPTACNVHGGVMYLGDEGVEFFDGNESTNVSAAINAELLPLDQANLAKYTAMYDYLRGWYYLFTPTVTYIFDLRFKRWYKRGIKVVSGTLFATQFAQEVWAAAVGTWAAQTLTWADKEVPEADKPDLTFLGDNAVPVRRIEKEDYASTLYYGAAQNPFWLTNVQEADMPSNKLFTVKAVRIEYEGPNGVDCTAEFVLNNGVSLGVGHLMGTGKVEVVQMKTNKTERAVMSGIYWRTGSSIVSSFETDIVERSQRRAVDARVAPVPAVIVPDVGLRDSPYWARPLRQNVSMAQLIGKVEQGQNGFGATFQSGWNATFKRYGTMVKEVGNNPAYWAAGIGLTPGRLIDPAEVTIPIIIRIRDVVGVVRTAGATFGSVAMVIGHEYPWQNAVVDSARNIGFHSLGTGNWWSYFSANNRTRLRGVDLGVPITQVCELMVEIDGFKKEIRWYIDGVLKDTFPVVVADVTVPTTAGVNPFAQLYHVCRPDAGVTLEFWHHMGIGALVEIERITVS